MYRRPEAWLGWCVLDLSDPFVQCLGMMGPISGLLIII
jgi:hypothetical protein